MEILSRDKILSAADLRIEEVDVPEWGGKIRLKALSGAERDRFEASVTIRQGKTVDVKTEMLRAKLVVVCIVDENGKRLFTDADAPLLAEKSATVIERLFRVAQRLAGMSDEDVKDLTEGFKTAQSEGSTSV